MATKRKNKTIIMEENTEEVLPTATEETPQDETTGVETTVEEAEVSEESEPKKVYETAAEFQASLKEKEG